MSKNSYKYSIIIPTLNEEEGIGKLLSVLTKEITEYNSACEIIIIDGFSNDETVNICKNFNTRIIYSGKGRGIQLNSGAKIAKGEILIFLHADTLLPKNVFNTIDKSFNNNINLATFKLKFDSNKLLYQIYSYFTKFETMFTTFGDQALIVKKDFFNKMGGFKNQKIMEDVDFLKRARKVTSMKKINDYVITSARKFEKEGLIKTQIKSFILIIKYLFGVSPEKIYQSYYNNEKRKSNSSFRKISGAWESKN